MPDTIIRLVNIESFNGGINYRFTTNDDDYHEITITIIGENGPIKNTVIDVQSGFEYYVQLREENTKLIIQEGGKKLYQRRILRTSSSNVKIPQKASSIKENQDEENDKHNEMTIETTNDDKEINTTKNKTIIHKDLSFNHEEIFNIAMKILS